jgi:hypothetical protein
VPTSWTGAYRGLTVGRGYLDGTVTDTAAAFRAPGRPAGGPALEKAIHRRRVAPSSSKV